MSPAQQKFKHTVGTFVALAMAIYSPLTNQIELAIDFYFDVSTFTKKVQSITC